MLAVVAPLMFFHLTAQHSIRLICTDALTEQLGAVSARYIPDYIRNSGAYGTEGDGLDIWREKLPSIFLHPAARGKRRKSGSRY